MLPGNIFGLILKNKMAARGLILFWPYFEKQDGCQGRLFDILESWAGNLEVWDGKQTIWNHGLGIC